MAKEPGGIDRSESIEDLHHLRLMALLDEQVRDKGPRRAAADLDVDHRTLTASLESGRLSRRMRSALNQALLAGAGSPAKKQGERYDVLAGRVERVEGQVDELGEEVRQGLSDMQGEVRQVRTEQEQSVRRIEGRLARIEGGGGFGGSTPSGVGRGSGLVAAPRRQFPDLATLEPAADDEPVFGGAWPLIQEWRELRSTHPDKGKGLEWLRDEERLMSVELALLEEHGLTLPPQTYPLKGLDRNAQTNWRRQALEDARRARRRRERLRWPLRALRLKLRRS